MRKNPPAKILHDNPSLETTVKQRDEADQILKSIGDDLDERLRQAQTHSNDLVRDLLVSRIAHQFSSREILENEPLEDQRRFAKGIIGILEKEENEFIFSFLMLQVLSRHSESYTEFTKAIRKIAQGDDQEIKREYALYAIIATPDDPNLVKPVWLDTFLIERLETEPSDYVRLRTAHEIVAGGTGSRRTAPYLGNEVVELAKKIVSAPETNSAVQSNERDSRGTLFSDGAYNTQQRRSKFLKIQLPITAIVAVIGVAILLVASEEFGVLGISLILLAMIWRALTNLAIWWHHE